jgi:glycogen operon protein
VEFEIPQYEGLEWRRSLDTALPSPLDIDISDSRQLVDQSYLVTPHSIVVLVSNAIAGTV